MGIRKSYLNLDDQLCFAAYSASLAFNKVYKKSLQRLGVTYPQYLVMLILWERDDRTVTEIGEKLFLNSATLTPLLKRLESLKLITRQRSNVDQRQVHIELTKAGRDLRAKAEEIPYKLACAAELTPEKLGDLKVRLNKLRDTLLNSEEAASP